MNHVRIYTGTLLLILVTVGRAGFTKKVCIDVACTLSQDRVQLKGLLFMIHDKVLNFHN